MSVSSPSLPTRVRHRHQAPRRRLRLRRGRGALLLSAARTPADLAAWWTGASRPAAGARARLGGVLRPADRRGPRGLRPPPPHRVPGPRGGRASLGRGPWSSTCAAARARWAPRWPRHWAGPRCTPPTSTRPPCGAPAATSPPPAARCTRATSYEPLPAALRGRVDVLVANAPYVPTEAIGLHAAGGPPARAAGGARRRRRTGSTSQRRVAAEAPRWLAPGGHLLIETSEQQAPQTAEAFVRHGLRARVTRSDELSATAVIGTMPSAEE